VAILAKDISVFEYGREQFTGDYRIFRMYKMNPSNPGISYLQQTKNPSPQRDDPGFSQLNV
jgi:hypothetical protein